MDRLAQLGILIITAGLVVGLLAACADERETNVVDQGVPATEASPAEDQPDRSPESGGVYEQAACPFDVPEGTPLDCGFVIVAEDHDHPDGPSIRIAVAILSREGSTQRKPDPLVVLAGGPGEETVASAPALMDLLAPIVHDRDLIIFDQRGVGLSVPALECPELEASFVDTLDEPNPEVAASSGFEAIRLCRDRLVEAGVDLSLYNSRQSAADVNAIRLALGYDVINLLGGSYGSLLAQTTMRAYPKRIRSVVMSSVLPLEKSIFVDSVTANVTAVTALLERCATDDACNDAYPDLRRVLFEIIDELNAQPISISVTDPRDGRRYAASLSGDTVLGTVVALLYQTRLLPALPQAIYDVYHGDYGLLAELMGQNFALRGALSQGMELSVVCADDLIGRTPEELRELQESLPRQLVSQLEPDVALRYGIFAICDLWPVEEAEPAVKEPLVSDTPTLLLSGEFDPVTPPAYARVVAKNLRRSWVFEFPGIGHDIIVASECARRIAAAFLDEPGRPPDPACIADSPGVVFDVLENPEDLVLTPFVDAAAGFRGLVPLGWKEPAPNNFLRGRSALDPTALVLEARPGSAAELMAVLVQQLKLDPELEPIRTDEVGYFTWNFYTFELRGDPADLALAQDGQKAYFVLMLSVAEEHETLYEQLFLPAVSGMAPQD